MPAPISIECEHCGVKLRLADRSKLGKKIKCPKCAEIFVATLEEEDDLEDAELDETEVDQDNDELDSDEEEVERPAKRRGNTAVTATKAGKKSVSAKGKGKGKGKSQKAGSNLGLIIGIALGVLVLLGGGTLGALYASGMFSAPKLDPNQIVVNGTPGKGLFSSLLKDQGSLPVAPRGPIPEEAKWLPADSEMIIQLRVADVLAAPLTQDWLKLLPPDALEAEMLVKAGLKTSDIENVMIAMFGLDQFETALEAQKKNPAMSAAANPLSTVFVAKLKTPLTDSGIQQVGSVQKSQHAGKDLYEVTSPLQAKPIAIYRISDQLVLMGDTSVVKSALEKGPQTTPVPNFGFVDWNQQLVISLAPKNPKLIRNITYPPTTDANTQKMFTAIKDGVTGYGLGLSLGKSISGEIAFGCGNKTKLETLVKALHDSLNSSKQQYSGSKSQLPQWAVPLTDDVVFRAKVEGNNRVAVISTQIPETAQAQLAQLPTMIMTQMAMGRLTMPNAISSPQVASPGQATATPAQAPASPGQALTPPPTVLKPAPGAGSEPGLRLFGGDR